MAPQPGPHAHGGDDEDEPEIKPRVDGPPFADLTAKQGRGFEADYDKVQKLLGPGKVSLSDFLRDIELINRVYVPSAHKSYIYMQAGTAGMMAGFVILIVMGIIGGTPDIRSIVIPVSFTAFVVGLVSFLFSKWVEQGGIRGGAEAVKKIIDDAINPKYAEHPHRLRYTVAVHIKPKNTLHIGKALLERPVVSLWVLRSANSVGEMTNWSLPEALTRGDVVTVEAAASATSPRAH